MKKLLVIIFLLASAHQAFGMKSVKNRIFNQLNKNNITDAYTTYTMYKGVFPHLSFSRKEKENVRTPLNQTLKKTNEEVVKDSFSILRTHCWWLLPASATLLSSTQEPLLVSLGLLGTTLGSFGFKKQCDYIANTMIYKQLCDKANTIEKIFESKKSELKTK